MDFTHFNPQSQKEDDFLANFVARRGVLEYFLRQLRLLEPNRPAVHHLIVALRGYGKTSLLRRVAIAVRTEPDLKSRLIALSFREEQHNVISLDVFWRNCLQSLLEVREDEEAVEAEIKQLEVAWDKHAPRQRLKREDQDGEPAKQEFTTYCESLGRRPLLLVDNLDALLEGLPESHQWSLRNDLQSAGGPILIAAASRYPDSTHDAKSAFYDFFRVQTLDKLDNDEVMYCLRVRAENRGAEGKKVLDLIETSPGRVAALNTLAGGNPRTLGVLYSVLESHASADVLSQLSAMLDTFTGWYQARTAELPIQSRAVFDALALNWDPMTAATVGEVTGLDTTIVSSQLSRLEKSGYVETVSLSRRKRGRNGYQVSERFFNIWYLMRNGPRRARQSIKFLAVFLQSCFSPSERHSIARSVLQDGRADPGYALALASSMRDSSLRNRLIEHADTQSVRLGRAEEYGDAIEELRSLGSNKKLVIKGEQTTSHESIESLNRIIARLRGSRKPASRVEMARALINKGLRLGQLGQSEDELRVYDDVLEHFGEASETALRKQVVRALVNKGATLGELGQSADAIKVYDDILARFGDAEDPELREGVARALVNKGATLGELARSGEAVEVFDDVVARFGGAQEEALRVQVARALRNKSIKLGQLGQAEEAIKVCDDVIARFGEAPGAALREQVAEALVNKAFRLGQLGKAEGEIEVYDSVLQRFGAAQELALREQVAWALVNKGGALLQRGQSEDAIKVYDEVVVRFGDAEDATLRERVGWALVNKGVALDRLGQAEHAIKIYDDVVARFGEAQDAALRERVARALVSKGITLVRLGQPEGAIQVYEDVVARFGEAQEMALRERVARALVNRGIALGQLGQADAAIKVFDEVVARFGAAQEAALREGVARALVNKAFRLVQLGQSENAIKVYDDVIARFDAAQEAPLREQVARALVNKGVTLGMLGQAAGAIEVYDSVVERFGQAHDSALLEQVAGALVNKGVSLGQIGPLRDAIKVYDDVEARFGEAQDAALRERVAAALINKGATLGQLGQSEGEIEVYDEVVARFGEAQEASLREDVTVVLNSLGNSLLEKLGDPTRAMQAFEQGLGRSPSPGIKQVLHLNYAYALALHTENRSLALAHVTSALALGDGISASGRDLLKALGSLGEPVTSWQNVFEHIGAAVEREDELLWSAYLDDLQRMLWYVIAHGQGNAWRQLMETRQYPMKFAPLYHAVVAAIEGEDHLLKINPETRQAAMGIFDGLARRLKLYPGAI